MIIPLRVYPGRIHEYDSGSLTLEQCTALRGLTLTEWVAEFNVHRDSTLKTGKTSAWSVSITDDTGRVHGITIQPDGTIRHARPRELATAN